VTRARQRPTADRLLDLAAGLVSRRIFSDEAIYQRELERVFARCWLFLAHDAMIPAPGDYVGTFMGEDPVIVCRGTDGQVRALLNTCRHRGNRVCLFPRGNAKAFTCAYHGWTYDTAGRLTGVPFHGEAYYGRLPREDWGLIEVPRVEQFGGLWFGCWDPAAPSLAAYLDGMAWYLDKFLLPLEAMGGLEVLESRYQANGNWKIAAENFAGDHYHTPTTHGSSFKLGLADNYTQLEPAQLEHGPFEIALAHGHGLGGVYTGDKPYRDDLAVAERLGPEAVAYLQEWYGRLQERLRDTPAKPYSASHWNIFPNLGLVWRSPLRAFNLFHLQPKGPTRLEVWQWALMPKAAPAVVKELAWAQNGRGGHFASGFFAQDDAENFDRVTEGSRTLMARQVPFNYAMGLEYEGHWPGQEQWDTRGLPGLVGPRFSEHNQRNFYRYWAERMGLEEA